MKNVFKEKKFDNTLLIKKIKENFYSISRFAEALGYSKSSMTRLVSGESYLSREDILIFSKALGIKKNEIFVYFFDIKEVA